MVSDSCLFSQPTSRSPSAAASSTTRPARRAPIGIRNSEFGRHGATVGTSARIDCGQREPASVRSGGPTAEKTMPTTFCHAEPPTILSACSTRRVLLKTRSQRMLWLAYRACLICSDSHLALNDKWPSRMHQNRFHAACMAAGEFGRARRITIIATVDSFAYRKRYTTWTFATCWTSRRYAIQAAIAKRRNLGVTQPTLSNRIAYLEGKLVPTLRS